MAIDNIFNTKLFGETMLQRNARKEGAPPAGNEFFADEDYIMDSAGAESNVAIGLSRLLDTKRTRTVWVSRFGDDKEADHILEFLADQDIEVVAPKIKGQKTGKSYVHHLEGGSKKIYKRKGSAASKMQFSDVKPHLTDTHLVHVTGITPALSDSCYLATLGTLSHCQDHNIPVSFDANYREQLWKNPEEARRVFDDMLPYANFFKVGHDEAKNVWNLDYTPEQYAEFFAERTGGIIVVTRDSGGAIALEDGKLYEHPGFEVDTSKGDSIGAGDAFWAGFLSYYISEVALGKKQDSEEIIPLSMERANACGALTCTKHGDTAAMPTLQEVDDFLASRSK